MKEFVGGRRVVNKISIKVYGIYWFDLYIYKVYTAKPIHVQNKQYRQPYIIIAFLCIDEFNENTIFNNAALPTIVLKKLLKIDPLNVGVFCQTPPSTPKIIV